MTERLYYLDSYLRRFEASVVERADQGKRIYLDRTAFYPASGGQPSDSGLLGGIPVEELVDEADKVAHLLERPLTTDTVTGEIDWPRRLDHMQQHTGQHLLSAVLADLLGYTTVAVHLGEETSTLDLDAAQLAPEEVRLVEQRANQIVTENRPVQISFEDASQASGLRKPTSRSGTIRIVSIAGLDRSACGGTHVRTTGEIGCILLRKVERARKAVRLEFLCGLRAVGRSRREAEVLARLTAELSCSVDELPPLIAAQKAELKQAASAGRELEAELNLYRAKELYSGVSAGDTGLRRSIVRTPRGSTEELRGLAQAYASLPGAVFIGAIENPPSLLLGAAPDSGVNAGQVLKSILQELGGRGGGSATLAQGSLPDLRELEEALARLSGADMKKPA